MKKIFVFALLFFVSFSLRAGNVVKNTTTEQEYETFDAAVSAAKSGDMLELIDDAEIITDNEEGMDISGKTIVFSGGKYTLNGNSKTINLKDNATLTVIDGNLCQMLIKVDKNNGKSSKLDIEDGEFLNFSAYTYGNGRTKIKNGNFESCDLRCYNYGEMEVLAGEFENTSFFVQNYTCKITMGEVGGELDSIICDGCEFQSLVSWAGSGTASQTTPRINVNSGKYNKCIFYTEHNAGMGTNHHPTINVANGIFSESIFQAGITECTDDYLKQSGNSTINITDGNYKKCAFSASKLGKQEVKSVIKGSKVQINITGGVYDEQCVYGIYGDNAFINVNREDIPSFPSYSDEEIAKPFLVGETGYSTLQEAYDASEEEDVIKLRSYYIQNETITLGEKSLKIDADGQIFFGTLNNGRGISALGNSNKIGRQVILSNGFFISAHLTSSSYEGRLTAADKESLMETPYLVLNGGFFWKLLIKNTWSGCARVNAGRFEKSEFISYNFTSFILIGEELSKPEFNNCIITVATGHDGYDNTDKWWGDAFGIIYNGVFSKCNIGLWTLNTENHKPHLDIYEGDYRCCNIRCLKGTAHGTQMPSMRIYKGLFLRCNITEQGIHKDSNYTSLEGKIDSDLVLCGGKYSESPTATIDSKCVVNISPNSNSPYKYRVVKRNWFRLMIR